MTTQEKKEVAKVEEKSVANVAMEGYDMSELMADAKLGSERLSSDDIAIPYIGILQGLSPQVTEGKEGFIEGARPSMFFNNVTNEIYEGRKNGVMLVPAHYRKQWLVWMDRDSGGGLTDVHDTPDILNDCVKNDKGQFVIKDNTKLVVFETAQHFMLRLNPETGEIERVVMSMKSTGLRANRKLNHSITSAKIPGHPTVNAPRFMFAYRTTTFLEEKNNNSWWSPEFNRMKDPVSKAVYAAAKEYYEMVKDGNVKLAEDSNPTAEVGGAAMRNDDPAAGRNGDSDEIPY